jgi:peptidoglycan/xylan/chitin deacetylase (PgdA/CDA1 family)
MAKRFNIRVQLPSWFNRLYPDAFWRLATGEKTVYLTFDDGPVPEITEAVLNILKERNIVATFFCVGDNVSKYPEIYQKIITGGHATGNHTFNHLHGIKNDNNIYFSNIDKAAGVIKSDLFRPPYGLLKRSQYKALINQYKIIMWDVISCDYDPSLKPKQCYRNVIDFVRDGSIITFHDSIKAKQNVLTALPMVIDQLQKEGYTFKKIEFSASQPNTKVSGKLNLKRVKNTNHNIIKRA